MPAGYTKNFLFEIEGTTVTYRHSAVTPIEEARTFTVFDDRDEVRHNLLIDLFGHDKLSNLNWSQLTLPLASKLTLTKKNKKFS